MSQETVYIGNDNIITLDALKDSVTGAYINDAVVTAQLWSTAAIPVKIGADIAMAYIAQSDGKYQGGIDDTVAVTLIDFQKMILKVTAAASGFRKGYWEIVAYARKRSE